MLKIWDRAEQIFAGMLGIAALALALWQVASRYFFPQNSISYAEEAIVYLMIWAIMIVSSQLVRADGHVRPDLVLNVVPPGAKRWMEAFNSVAAVAFCAALAWYGWQVVATALLIDEHSASDLRFPMWIYYVALPASGLLMSLRYLIRLAALLSTRQWSAMLPRHAGGHESLAHDPEKWKPVFGTRSRASKNLERDGDSKQNHPALASIEPAP